MADLQLLNPQDESVIAKRMIERTRARLERAEQRLTHSVLARDDYLIMIGSANALREAVNEMVDDYNSTYNI